MRYRRLAGCLATQTVFLFVMWSFWEVATPFWWRVLLSIVTVLSPVLLWKIRKKDSSQSLVLITLLATALPWIGYLTLPIQGHSVTSRLVRSVRHLSDQAWLTNSPDVFAGWIAAGTEVHADSPFFMNRFQLAAQGELLRCARLTQKNLQGSAEELIEYEKWQTSVPQLMESASGTEPEIARVKNALQEVQLVRQALTDCQAAVGAEQWNKLANIVAQMNSQLELNGEGEHIGNMARRVCSMVEHLEQLRAAGDGQGSKGI